MISNAANIQFIKRRRIELVILPFLLIMLVTGLLLQPINQLVEGLINIFTAPGMLITDYMVVGGIGPALVNGAMVGLIGYTLLIINGVPFRGSSIAVLLTMFGFGLFGKTAWSILPIIGGVFIYCKLSGQSMITNIYPALYGTALAPLVTQAAFGYNWGIMGGILIGIIAGIIIPPIASHVLRFHEGYNLYNIGFTAGLVGLLILNVLRGFDLDSEIVVIWGNEFDSFLRIFTVTVFLSMIALGIILAKHRLRDYLKILKHPGTLITDFTNISGFGNTLINMGIVGLIGIFYIELVGGNYNGPVLGGLYTMVGFAAFGKHPLNITPIMAGVWLATVSSIYQPSSPGPILAALFGTTLAPIAGQFGPIVGILAGGIHLFIVSRIGGIHGGLNLYNNGFSAGFVAAIFVAIINGFKKKQ